MQSVDQLQSLLIISVDRRIVFKVFRICWIGTLIRKKYLFEGSY